MIPDQLSFAKFGTGQVVKPKIQVQPTTPNFGFSQKPTQKPEKFDFSNIVSTVKNVFGGEAEQNKPTTYTGRNESVMELQKGIEQANKETHKLNTLMDMKRYYDDGASFDEIKNDFKDVPQEIIGQLYDEFNLGTKFKDILKLYPELDNIQVPQELSNKYDIKKYFNPLGEVGKTILEAKQKSKKEGSFLTSNPLTQGFMGAIGGAVKGAGDLGAGIVGLSDTINAGAKSATQGGNVDQYKERPTTTSEDALNIFGGGTTTVGSVFALPAITLINAGIETLPQDQQVALSDSMDWLGDKIAQTPGLKQWMQSLPPDRQAEFKQELANAGVGLLLGLKNKKNIVTDPKTFLKENINPIDIAKNFNENVLGFASKVKDIPSTIKEGSKKPIKSLTRTIPVKVVENQLGLTPKERGKVEKTGITPAQYVLDKGIAGLSNEDKIHALQTIANENYLKVTEAFKRLPEGEVINDKSVNNMLGTMIDEMDRSPIVRREYKDYIDTLKTMSEQESFTPQDVLSIRRDFDSIVGKKIFDTQGRVSGLEDEIIAGYRSTANDLLQEVGERNGIDMREMNDNIRNSIAIRDGLLRSVSQSKKNNYFGLQDLGIGAVLGGGNPILGASFALGKKVIENKSPGLMQWLYNRDKTSLTKTIPQKGASFISNNNNNNDSRFSLSSNSNSRLADIQGQELKLDQTNVRKGKVGTTPKKVITKDDSIVKKEGNLINNTLGDNTPTTVKKKSVQSDTLVSKSDVISKADEMKLVKKKVLFDSIKATPEDIQLERSKTFIEDIQKEIADYKKQQKTATGNDKIWLDRLIPKKEKALQEAIDEVAIMENKKGSTAQLKNKLSPKPKELQSLYDEAKKYKSAEDMIENMVSKSDSMTQIKDPLYHVSSSEIKNLTDDKILWTTSDSDYAMKFGKRDSRILYEVNGDIKQLDTYSTQGKKIIESINQSLPKEKKFSTLFNEDGGVSSFFIQDKDVVEKLRKLGYDAVVTSESIGGSQKAIGIINPSKVKISKSTSIPKDLAPLYEEARKYKTAEEFTKTQGEKVYHGTRHGEKDVFDKIYENKSSFLGDGIYFTNNKNDANSYIKMASRKGTKGKTPAIIESYISKDAKVIDLSLGNEKIRQEIIDYIKSSDNQELSSISQGILDRTKGDIEFLIEIIGKRGGGKELKDFFIQKGYDGVKTKSMLNANPQNGSYETVIYNLDKIKTEAQLRKIREEANK